jgi:integrase
LKPSSSANLPAVGSAAQKPEYCGILPQKGIAAMPRRPNPIPTYRHHKQSGQAIVTLRLPGGGRKDVLLGPYDTDESKAEYERVLAEWRASGGRAVAPSGLTVNELVLAFWKHVEQHYRRPDGSPTSEVNNYRVSFRHLRRLYGMLPATELSPLKLKAIRDEMIRAGWVRSQINARVGRIVRMFKWAVGEELVPETAYRALTAVAGLQRGRCDATESEPVTPVPDALVDAILPHVLPPVRAMIELQRLTGMRPGEVCAMRACDLDMTGAVWLYRPSQHKTAWRGKPRVVALGRRAQAIVKPFLTLNTQAFLFSSARGLAERAVTLRANRKTKVQPSQQRRRRKNPKHVPRDRYTVTAYEHAIRRGCELASRVRACAICKAAREDRPRLPNGKRPPWRPWRTCGTCAGAAVPHWCPNQLRHNFATLARRQYGLEAAQVALGHSRADVTQIYAERDLSLALKVAAEVG